MGAHGSRTLSPRDWAFDGLVRSAPLFLWNVARGGDSKSKTLTATAFAAGYFSLACSASP